MCNVLYLELHNIFSLPSGAIVSLLPTEPSIAVAHTHTQTSASERRKEAS